MARRSESRTRFVPQIAFCLLLVACTVTIRNPRLHEATTDAVREAARASAASASQSAGPEAARRGPISGIAKLHLQDGDVVVLRSWTFGESGSIAGIGIRYDAERKPRQLSPGPHGLPLDSIALLETDDPTTALALSNAVRNVWTVAWGAATVLCAMDPKSCFGSCPTFYVDGVDTGRPRAEGFSSSIARIREAADVDDLAMRGAAGDAVVIRMRNEAWETHAVRWVRLRAVPTLGSAEIVATSDGRFLSLGALSAPARCRATTGDCRAAVAARDAVEWQDVTDAADLTRPDTMELSFGAAGVRPALVLSARQSFVSTFVLYETMAWLGSAAGEWLARLERGDPMAVRALDEVERLIGTVRVEQRTAHGAWVEVAEFREAGPIAIDRHVVPLQPTAPDTPLDIRLIFAKGNWRVDEAQLAQVEGEVESITLDPEQATRTARGPGASDADSGPAGAARDESVRDRLLDPSQYLLTYPGDEITLTFQLPALAPQYALFLESRGHYYEWMRGEWMAEQDLGRLATLMRAPAEGLRWMAPRYKAREATFESIFWASRFGRVGGSPP